MSNGNPDPAPQPQKSDWPSTVVAMGILLFAGAVSVTAIVHYNSVDDALKIWSGLTAIIGVITGAFVSYFFTRGTAQAAAQSAQAAQQTVRVAQQAAQIAGDSATNSQQVAEDAAKRAEASSNALTATFGHITDQGLLERVRQDPAVVEALGPLPQ